jgi:hypothetical protein
MILEEGKAQPRVEPFKHPENELLAGHISEIEASLFDLPHFYFGGVAVDGVLGTETRPHDDLDIWVISKESFQEAKQRLIGLGYREPSQEEIQTKLKWVKDDATRLIHEDGTEVDLGTLYQEDENTLSLPIEALDGNLYIPKQATEGQSRFGQTQFPSFTQEALYLLKYGAVHGVRKGPVRLIPLWQTSRRKDIQDLKLLRAKIDLEKAKALLDMGWRYEGKGPYFQAIVSATQKIVKKLLGN